MSQEARAGVVETLPGSWAPPGSRPVELVFRTVGERTSDLALDLALRHVKPHRAHVLRDVRPWSAAVQRMLGIDHRCSHIVYVDADCLILEDMRPFLDANELAYVDCFVHDRFRGRIHCGVHITRLDVVEAMRAIPEPVDALAYVLTPEGYLRGLALRRLGLAKRLKGFHILHDHFQRHTDIFVKYARRELRSRRYEPYRDQLHVAMSSWDDSPDFEVARHAVRHARASVPRDATSGEADRYLRGLPCVAAAEVRMLGFEQDGQVGMEEVEKAVANDPPNLGPPSRDVKVFGLGLSRTGTRSLTTALHVLGLDTVHYPVDHATLDALIRGDGRFPLLEHYGGITDITVVPYYEALDRAWPGSKFVLTVRDIDTWLDSCARHWSMPMADKGNGEVHFEIQRFLRAAVYGSYEFEPERFRHVYTRHVESVMRYFAGREDDLLVLDIVAGQGYERLAPFLGVPVPPAPFPKGNSALV